MIPRDLNPLSNRPPNVSSYDTSGHLSAVAALKLFHPVIVFFLRVVDKIMKRRVQIFVSFVEI
jgi:hypothetical protein